MDRLTFNMPDSLEDFLYAALVLKEKLQGLRLACASCRGSHQPCTHGGTQYRAVVSRRQDFECIAGPMLADCHRVAELDRETLDNSDVVVMFDRDRAYSLSLATKQHAVGGFGALVGASPAQDEESQISSPMG